MFLLTKLQSVNVPEIGEIIAKNAGFNPENIRISLKCYHFAPRHKDFRCEIPTNYFDFFFIELKN